MRQLYLTIFLLLSALAGYSQVQDKAEFRKQRKEDMYKHRKYSYGLSDYWYGFHPNSTIFHAVDVFFSQRIRSLGLGNIASSEITGGFSFQPYQGFRLHAGFDYEWLTPTKVHLYIGGQYALGLKQRTIASDGLSSVVVGCHSYLVPFLGVMYWPGKRDRQTVKMEDSVERVRYLNPTFWQLVYIKGQIGCSSLISNLSVTPTATFDKSMASNIRQNVSSGLYLSIGVGINLPTFSNTKLIQPGLR